MAIGDRIPTELCLMPIPATVGTIFTNSGVGYRTQVTQMLIANTGVTQRAIMVYKNGIDIVNIIMSGIIVPPNSSVVIDMKLVCTGTQTISAKQDTGTDCNIALYGVIEQIA